MPDYSNGKIYKLTSSNGNLCYVGSTTRSLDKRLLEHLNSYNCWKDNKCSYITSFKVIEDETETIIELLENYQCNSRKELEIRERHYIESNKCVNKTIPGRTDKEYREEYYSKNKDVLNAKANAKHTCECGGNYAHKHRSTHFKTLKHQKFVKQQSESD